jgi:hypothetical protein
MKKMEVGRNKLISTLIYVLHPIFSTISFDQPLRQVAHVLDHVD